jgi:hypothetical protein
MVDIATVLSLVFAGIATVWAILATLVPKHKELRKSLHDFRQRTRERLNQTNVSLRWIVRFMIVSIWVGMGIYYYLPDPNLARWIGLGLGGIWFIIAGLLFGNPKEEDEELITRKEVEELVQRRLKQEREKSSNT